MNNCQVFFLSTSDNCLDVDECNQQECNGYSASCKNTVGSYECQCPTGYNFDDSSGDCDDINECDYIICEGRYSTCVNVEGSYWCDDF